MAGQPPKYTEELAAIICKRLAAGETLRAICRDENMPDRSTVHEWVISDINGFSGQYARARATGMDEIADGTRDIANDGSNDTYTDDEGRTRTDYDVIARSKLRVENDWKYLAKMDKRYHDKTTTELTGADGAALFTDEDREKRLAALLRRIAQNKQPEPTDASDLA